MSIDFRVIRRIMIVSIMLFSIFLLVAAVQELFFTGVHDATKKLLFVSCGIAVLNWAHFWVTRFSFSRSFFNNLFVAVLSGEYLLSHVLVVVLAFERFRIFSYVAILAVLQIINLIIYGLKSFLLNEGRDVYNQNLSHDEIIRLSEGQDRKTGKGHLDSTSQD